MYVCTYDGYILAHFFIHFHSYSRYLFFPPSFIFFTQNKILNGCISWNIFSSAILHVINAFQKDYFAILVVTAIIICNLSLMYMFQLYCIIFSKLRFNRIGLLKYKLFL